MDTLNLQISEQTNIIGLSITCPPTPQNITEHYRYTYILIALDTYTYLCYNDIVIWGVVGDINAPYSRQLSRVHIQERGMIDDDTVVQDIDEELRLMFAIHKERFDREDMLQVRKRIRRSFSHTNRERMIGLIVEDKR